MAKFITLTHSATDRPVRINIENICYYFERGGNSDMTMIAFQDEKNVLGVSEKPEVIEHKINEVLR